MENTVSLSISRYREAIGKGNARAHFRNGVRCMSINLEPTRFRKRCDKATEIGLAGIALPEIISVFCYQHRIIGSTMVLKADIVVTSDKHQRGKAN